MSTRVKVVQPECPGIARKMTRKLRPLLLCGTRPEAIKLAPVIRECRHRTNEVEPVLCLTGQHREMLRQVTDYFDISADIDLELMRPNQTLAELTGHCLQRVDEVIARIAPDCVVAQGDTTTVLCASIVAFYRKVPFVHVEAGLRTGDLMAPWPEEFNRRVTSLTTALHCAPTKRAAQALLAEGIHPKQVRVTGNTVIDALLWARRRETADGARWRRQVREARRSACGSNHRSSQGEFRGRLREHLPGHRRLGGNVC